MADKLKEILDKVKVVSDEECEKCDYIVCMKEKGHVSRFDDNMVGECVECGERVIYRWHAPRAPKRICVECMIAMVEKEKSDEKTKRSST